MKSKNSIYQLTIFMFLSFLFTAEIKLGYINADKIFSDLDEVRQVSIEMEKEQRNLSYLIKVTKYFICIYIS